MAKLLGWSRVRMTDNVGGAFRQWNARFGAGAYAFDDATADVAYEARAGQTFSVRVVWGTSGAPAFGVQNTIRVSLFYETDQEGTNLSAATVIRTQTITDTAASGDQTLTFSATSNGDAGGTARSGTYRIRITVERTDAVAWGPMGSDGEDQNPPAANTRARDQACSRWGLDVSADSISNASFGGATPSPFAYPDSIFARVGLVGGLHNVSTNTNCKLRYRLNQSAAEKLNTLSALLTTAGSQSVDVKLGEIGANDGGVDTRLLSSLTAGDWQVDIDGNAAYVPASGAIRWCHFETITPAGWTTGDTSPSPGTKPRRITKASAANFDPRLTLNTPSVPALPRMRSEATSIGSTTALQATNARAEKIAAHSNATTTAKKSVDVDFSSENSQTIAPDGSNNYAWTYTPPSTSPAAWDKTGTDKTLNVAAKVFTSNNPTASSAAGLVRVSRYFYHKQSGGADETVFIGKTASPVSDQTTVRNRGQVAFFNATLFNARDAALGSTAGFFGIRRTDLETYEHALAAFTLASGVFSGASATYTVTTSAVTSPAGRALVFADSNAASAQSRTGTGGTGNFAETSRSSPEWTVSASYTVESRTQREATRNTDPEDLTYTVGDDTIYHFANVLDASSDPVNGAKLDMEQRDPSGVKRQEYLAVSTASDGWTTAQGFDTRTPSGSGWIQRATITSDAANNGNSGTNDQSISLLSAFTANKNITVNVFPAADPGRWVLPAEDIAVMAAFYVQGVRTAPDSSPVPRIAIKRKIGGQFGFEYLQADGTFAATQTFHSMTQSATQAETYYATLGPSGRTITMPVTALSAGAYQALVVLYRDGQEFRDDEDFKIHNNVVIQTELDSNAALILA